MKAEDLMIGDWLLYKGKPIKIIGTDGSQNIIYYYNEEDYTEYPIDASNIEPIPITPEILEKNGFGFVDTSNEYYSSVWTGWRILEGLELGCCDNSKFPVFFNIADTNVRVNYVHELQHALKLCGIKKDIVL